MRILAYSALYPPHHLGGYEQGCHEVLTRLRDRGHETWVLTSTRGGRPRRDGHVHRRVHFDFDTRGGLGGALSLLRQELTARRAIRRLAARLRPDLLYVWSPRFVSLAPLTVAEELGIPVCAYVSDDWLARWDDVDNWHGAGALVSRLARFLGGPRRAGRPRALALQFASTHVHRECRDAGWPVADAPIIPWGVDPDRFAPGPRAPERPLRILWAGQLVPHKGAHVAIAACRLLAESRGARTLSLTLVGPSRDAGYQERLQAQVRDAGLLERVTFTGTVTPDRLPGLFQAHDVLVFSSSIPEALSLTLLEGMSAGLAVVSTALGGNAEILRDGVNALVFAPDDAPGCAARLLRLADEPALRSGLGRIARETITREFTVDGMVVRIEAHLQEVAAGARRHLTGLSRRTYDAAPSR